MNQPLISIIITVLNGAKTISKCLMSIANQSFSNYELVIVDGGSKDNTVQLINESLIINKTVCAVPGIGLYAGLNMGVNLSIGKWLYFMGADDELHSSDTLQHVSEIMGLKKSDTKIIVGNVECVKQENILKPRFGSPYLMRHLVHHQGMFYARAIFTDMMYNETMRIASDYEFNLKLALTGVKHQSMDIIVCNFGGDGISENQLKQGYTEMQQIHRRLFKGLGRFWVINYFWLRRNTGTMLRRYNLLKFRMGLKKLFG
jgi:glycosyltransferase involved in cell wall biosynthesis